MYPFDSKDIMLAEINGAIIPIRLEDLPMPNLDKAHLAYASKRILCGKSIPHYTSAIASREGYKPGHFLIQQNNNLFLRHHHQNGEVDMSLVKEAWNSLSLVASTLGLRKGTIDSARHHLGMHYRQSLIQIPSMPTVVEPPFILTPQNVRLFNEMAWSKDFLAQIPEKYIFRKRLP